VCLRDEAQSLQAVCSIQGLQGLSVRARQDVAPWRDCPPP
jgi:hypothetical protein